MKSTDLHADARREWLRNEQTPCVTPSEAARQSNFEKSLAFKCVIVAALLVIVANVLEESPEPEVRSTYRTNV